MAKLEKKVILENGNALSVREAARENCDTCTMHGADPEDNMYCRWCNNSEDASQYKRSPVRQSQDSASQDSASQDSASQDSASQDSAIMNGIVIKPDGSIRLQEFPDSLKALQQIVGGSIELVHAKRVSAPYAVYCNEEGKLPGYRLPMNPIATYLYDGQPDFLVGTVVIVKHDGRGEHIPMTPEEAQELIYDIMDITRS